MLPLLSALYLAMCKKAATMKAAKLSLKQLAKNRNAQRLARKMIESSIPEDFNLIGLDDPTIGDVIASVKKLWHFFSDFKDEFTEVSYIFSVYVSKMIKSRKKSKMTNLMRFLMMPLSL